MGINAYRSCDLWGFFPIIPKKFIPTKVKASPRESVSHPLSPCVQCKRNVDAFVDDDGEQDVAIVVTIMGSRKLTCDQKCWHEYIKDL